MTIDRQDRGRVWLCGVWAALLLVCGFLLAGCRPTPRPPTPAPPPPPDPAYVAAIEADCAAIFRAELAREIDPPALEGCRGRGLVGAVGWQEDFRAWLQTTDEYAALHAHYDPSTVPLEQLARIRGAMWTETWPCPLGPRPGQPTNVCATDFLWNYDEATRLQIVEHLVSLGYTHAVVGPLVDGDGYHGTWSANDWRGANFERFLDMLQFLWDHGLAPVVFLTPDNWSLEQARAELTPLLLQERAQRLIRIAVRAWEPCKYECSSYTWAAYGQWMRETLPRALTLLHTVCDVDAPVGTDGRGGDNGRPNAEGWQRVAPWYHGWLTQTCTYERKGGTDDAGRNNYMNWVDLFDPAVRGSYQDRFRHGYAGWPTSSAWGPHRPLKVYAAEYLAYWVFWQGAPKEDARAWGDAAMRAGADGYLDGGTLPVGDGPVPWQEAR